MDSPASFCMQICIILTIGLKVLSLGNGKWQSTAFSDYLNVTYLLRKDALCTCFNKVGNKNWLFSYWLADICPSCIPDLEMCKIKGMKQLHNLNSTKDTNTWFLWNGDLRWHEHILSNEWIIVYTYYQGMASLDCMVFWVPDEIYKTFV